MEEKKAVANLMPFRTYCCFVILYCVGSGDAEQSKITGSLRGNSVHGKA